MISDTYSIPHLPVKTIAGPISLAKYNIYKNSQQFHPIVMNMKKTISAIILSYLCLSGWSINAQPLESFAELSSSRTANLVKQRQHQEKSIDDQAVRLSQAGNSTCLLQAYSFHWYYIRIVSFQDTAYLPCDTDQYLKLTPNSVIAQMRTLPDAPYFVNLPGIHFGTMDVVKSGLGMNYINIGTIRFFPFAN